MTGYTHRQGASRALADSARSTQVCDSIGYAVFSEGDAGAIHVMAHRMLDSGQISRGHQLLGEWLAHRDGSGSEWVHLQWHMAVFEVTLGHSHSASSRFRQHILPAVFTSYDALTDAPAFLWRLSLEGGKHGNLPWEPVRDRALLSLQQPCSPFVTAHNILAIAGAGDTDSLDKWINQKTLTSESHTDAIVMRIASGLQSYVRGRYTDAAQELSGIAPQFSRIGGSRAQNELFTRLHESACRKAAGVGPRYARAA